MEGVYELLRGLFALAMIGLAAIFMILASAFGAAVALPIALILHHPWIIGAGAGFSALAMAAYLSISIFGWRMPRL